MKHEWNERKKWLVDSYVMDVNRHEPHVDFILEKGMKRLNIWTSTDWQIVAELEHEEMDNIGMGVVLGEMMEVGMDEEMKS